MTPLTDSAKSWLNAALAFCYPEICQVCGKSRATPQQCFVCESCTGRLRRVQAPYCNHCGLPSQGAITSTYECANCQEMQLSFSSARAAVIANEVALDLIHKFKYQRARWFEPLLAGLLVDAAKPDLAAGNWTCIVPIPLHPTKHREREFNQAERIARSLSAATGLPVRTGHLRRVVPTRTQTLLSRQERMENVRRAFAAAGAERLDGDRIILVDDVLTTGATADACSRALLKAGAAEVCVWTVARGI
jgi:ComF family protein